MNASFLLFSTTDCEASILTTATGSRYLPEVYDTVIEKMVSVFWEDCPELYLRHHRVLLEFVHSKVPVRHFLSRHRQWARRHRPADPVPRAIEDAVAGSSRAIDVYVRRYVETDFTAPLIDAARTFEEACHIAWIVHELSVLDFQEITGRTLDFQAQDRVYAFCSPIFSWENGFGCQGLIAVRANLVLESVVLEKS
jgi:hypothetical protein